MEENYLISPLGDGALVIQFANRIDVAVNARVLQLFHRLQNAATFIVDVVPAYGSLAVYFDVLQLHTSTKSAFETMKELLHPLLTEQAEKPLQQERTIRIPVCYHNRFAPDLAELSRQKQMTEKEVIRLHTTVDYRVYMIGFLPGFPYMGTVDSRIAAPRKNNPRKEVAAGSVGIAGEQTGIYPFASPGGWNIIGRTPLLLFDKHKQEPVLLQPGDTVQFFSITENEFENYPGRTS